jgi:hypothetical protein
LSVTGGINASGGLNVTGGATFGGNIDVQRNTVSNSNLRTYTEPALTAAGAGLFSSVLNCDLNVSQVFHHNLLRPITRIDVENVSSTTGTAIGFTIVFTQNYYGHPGYTGPYSVNFTSLSAGGTGATVKFPGGISPSMSTSTGKVDIVSYVTYNNGTTWYGFGGGQGY